MSADTIRIGVMRVLSLIVGLVVDSRFLDQSKADDYSPEGSRIDNRACRNRPGSSNLVVERDGRYDIFPGKQCPGT